MSQMAFLSCKGEAKAGQKAGFRVMLKHFEIKKAFRYYIKQIYFIHNEIFASNFALWKSVSDFTSTNQRGERSFSHVKKSFRPITNHGLSELCFRGLFRGHRG